MALLLNVAGEYINLTEVVSKDGATVSQAITYCDNLIDDPAGDHERAKDIADLINNAKNVPDGMIPLTTLDIAYSPPRQEGDIPAKFFLYQSCPNPFNPSTTISFDLPEVAHVQLRIYDASGRLVSPLIDRTFPAGTHDVTWNGRNTAGHAVASGVYFYRLKAGNEIFTRKAVLLK